MNELSILGQVYEEIVRQNITARAIAKVLDVSPGAISQYFSGTHRMSFISFLKLVKFIYKDDIEKQKQLLISFCNNTDRRINQRLAMEYASSNYEFDLLLFLYKKEENSKNRTNVEWASVYELMYYRSQGKYNGNQLLQKLKSKAKRLKSFEMKILSDIITMLALYDLNEFNSLIKITNGLMEKLNKVTTKYIKDSFRLRIIELYVFANLMNNKVDEVRKLASEVINSKESIENSPLFTASIYHYYGQSFIFEDKEKALYWTKKAIEILSENNNNDKYRNRINGFIDTADFIEIYKGDNLEEISPRSLAEKAHLEMKKGNYKEAIFILKQLEKENGKLTSFQLYYLGCAMKDKSLIEKSIESFENSGNKFFVKLPTEMLEAFC